MISYQDIGNYYKVVFIGKTLDELNIFFKQTKNIEKKVIPLLNEEGQAYVGWKIKKDDLNNILGNFSNTLEIKNEYDSIGDTMKLSPYLYQKEAIHFGLKSQNALIVLPCGAGKK